MECHYWSLLSSFSDKKWIEAWLHNGKVKGSLLLKHGGLKSRIYFYFLLKLSTIFKKNKNLQGKWIGEDMNKVCSMMESEMQRTHGHSTEIWNTIIWRRKSQEETQFYLRILEWLRNWRWQESLKREMKCSWNFEWAISLPYSLHSYVTTPQLWNKAGDWLIGETEPEIV